MRQRRPHNLDVTKLDLTLVPSREVRPDPRALARFVPLLPEDFHRLTGTDEFCAVSAFIGGQPLGLFYADRYGAPRALDAEAYHQFKQLVLAAARAVAKSLS